MFPNTFSNELGNIAILSEVKSAFRAKRVV